MQHSIGKMIKELRKNRGLTQEELAEKIGVTAQAISKWENESGMPDLSQIVPLAHVFGVSTDTLLGTGDTLSVLLILPVGGNAVLGDLMHLLRTDLHLKGQTV